MASSENIKKKAHARFVRIMLRDKKFRLVACDENEAPLLATTLYLDGDCLNEIYSYSGRLPVGNYQQKLDEHFDTFGTYLARLKNTSKTIKATAIIGLTALAFGVSESWLDNVEMQLGITAATFSIGVIFRRFFPKVIFGIFSRVGSMFFKSG
ncbi:MAG: hypothetical protein R2750_09290 [Bacteroidales bacterium]